MDTPGRETPETETAAYVLALAREVLELDAAATLGPWEFLPNRIDVRRADTGKPDTAAVAPAGAFDWICCMQLSNCPNWAIDAEFIANSRTAAPALARAVLAQAAALADKDAEIARMLDAVQMVYERQSRPRQREVDLQALELLLYAGGRIESPVDAP